MKSRVALLSVCSNTVLVALKLGVGLLIGSVAVISEAIHSGIDLFAALIAFFAVKTAGKPADEEHPFGHGKIENISGAVEAFLIFLAAGWIIYEAVGKLIRPAPLEAAAPGVAIMLVSAVTNVFVSRKLFIVAKQTESPALMADAWHLRTDVYTSAGIMVGLSMIWLGNHFLPRYNLDWIDPAGAIFVAVLIIKAAYDLTRESAQDLMDVNLPEAAEAMRGIIESYYPVIRGFHYLKARKSGSSRFVEVHIQVDSEMTVRESHRLAQELTRKFRESFPDSTVTIHVEPCTGECPEKCIEGCMMTEGERREIRGKG